MLGCACTMNWWMSNHVECVELSASDDCLGAPTGKLVSMYYCFKRVFVVVSFIVVSEFGLILLNSEYKIGCQLWINTEAGEGLRTELEVLEVEVFGQVEAEEPGLTAGVLVQVEEVWPRL